jgi:DNA-binding transcriptional regulator LsrR (DeoR family)
VRGIAGSYEVPGRDESAYNISWRLADLLEADIEQLYCPMIVADPPTRRALLKDRELKALAERIPDVDLGLIGIGALTQASPLLRMGYLDQTSLRTIQKRGAVGEIMGRFFDIDGQPVASPLDERIISIDFAGLCKIPNVIALANGNEKINPLLGALRGGCLNTLVSDHATAEAVLKLS